MKSSWPEPLFRRIEGSGVEAALLTRAGSLGPLVKARAFGMTSAKVVQADPLLLFGKFFPARRQTTIAILAL